MAIVDTHFHLWDPAAREHVWLTGLPSLNCRFGIEDFETVARGHGVTEAVLVQVLNDLGDTRDFLATAVTHAIVTGVVGWVPLEAPDVPDQIAALRESPGGDRLVSIRHLIQDEPDDAYAARASVIAGVRAVAEAGLAFDLVIRAHQLPAAIALVRAVPGCRFVLDHGAKPPLLGGGSLDAWERQVAELAGVENVTCKLSGLVTEAGNDWRQTDIRRRFLHLIERFGTSRVMFGSDWPVCTLVASYEDVLNLCQSALAELSASEREAALESNARHIYRLRGTSVS